MPKRRRGTAGGAPDNDSAASVTAGDVAGVGGTAAASKRSLRMSTTVQTAIGGTGDLSPAVREALLLSAVEAASRDGAPAPHGSLTAFEKKHRARTGVAGARDSSVDDAMGSELGSGVSAGAGAGAGTGGGASLYKEHGVGAVCASSSPVFSTGAAGALFSPPMPQAPLSHASAPSSAVFGAPSSRPSASSFLSPPNAAVRTDDDLSQLLALARSPVCRTSAQFAVNAGVGIVIADVDGAAVVSSAVTPAPFVVPVSAPASAVQEDALSQIVGPLTMTTPAPLQEDMLSQVISRPSPMLPTSIVSATVTPAQQEDMLSQVSLGLGVSPAPPPQQEDMLSQVIAPMGTTPAPDQSGTTPAGGGPAFLPGETPAQDDPLSQVLLASAASATASVTHALTSPVAAPSELSSSATPASLGGAACAAEGQHPAPALSSPMPAPPPPPPPPPPSPPLTACAKEARAALNAFSSALAAAPPAPRGMRVLAAQHRANHPIEDAFFVGASCAHEGGARAPDGLSYLFIVADGHGGHALSERVTTFLPDYVMRALRGAGGTTVADIVGALKTAFADLERKWMDDVSASAARVAASASRHSAAPGASGYAPSAEESAVRVLKSTGACATLMLVKRASAVAGGASKWVAFTANVGDSRVVLASEWPTSAREPLGDRFTDARGVGTYYEETAMASGAAVGAVSGGGASAAGAGASTADGGTSHPIVTGRRQWYDANVHNSKMDASGIPSAVADGPPPLAAVEFFVFPAAIAAATAAASGAAPGPSTDDPDAPLRAELSALSEAAVGRPLRVPRSAQTLIPPTPSPGRAGSAAVRASSRAPNARPVPTAAAAARHALLAASIVRSAALLAASRGDPVAADVEASVDSLLQDRRAAACARGVIAIPLTCDHTPDSPREAAAVRMRANDMNALRSQGLAYVAPDGGASVRATAMLRAASVTARPRASQSLRAPPCPAFVEVIPVPRVAGSLAISRALGDSYLKTAALSFPPFEKGVPYISAEPEVSWRVLQPSDRFAILASDGVWDALTNAEAIDIVSLAIADAALVAADCVREGVGAKCARCGNEGHDAGACGARTEEVNAEDTDVDGAADDVGGDGEEKRVLASAARVRAAAQAHTERTAAAANNIGHPPPVLGSMRGSISAANSLATAASLGGGAATLHAAPSLGGASAASVASVPVSCSGGGGAVALPLGSLTCTSDLHFGDAAERLLGASLLRNVNKKLTTASYSTEMDRVWRAAGRDSNAPSVREAAYTLAKNAPLADVQAAAAELLALEPSKKLTGVGRADGGRRYRHDDMTAIVAVLPSFIGEENGLDASLVFPGVPEPVADGWELSAVPKLDARFSSTSATAGASWSIVPTPAAAPSVALSSAQTPHAQSSGGGPTFVQQSVRALFGGAR